MGPGFKTGGAQGYTKPFQWYAPEIISSLKRTCLEPPTASKPADIFAFAMLVVEVFAGTVPFGNMKNKAVKIQILEGKRPLKPPTAERLGLTEEMWKFIGKCWYPNQNKRPAIDEVVRAWNGFVSVYVASRSTSSASRRTTSGENGRIMVPGTLGRRSTASSTPFADQTGKPPPSRGSQTHELTCRKAAMAPRKKLFCGLL